MRNLMIKIGKKNKPQYIKSRLNYIIEQRIKLGKNKPSDLQDHTLSIGRILLAAMRHDRMVNDLINADFVEEDRKNE